MMTQHDYHIEQLVMRQYIKWRHTLHASNVTVNSNDYGNNTGCHRRHTPSQTNPTGHHRKRPNHSRNHDSILQHRSSHAQWICRAEQTARGFDRTWARRGRRHWLEANGFGSESDLQPPDDGDWKVTVQSSLCYVASFSLEGMVLLDD